MAVTFAEVCWWTCNRTSTDRYKNKAINEYRFVRALFLEAKGQKVKGDKSDTLINQIN